MSQESLILAHLRSGKTLTPLEALRLWGCFRLGARVFNLKKQGHDIRCEMVDDLKTDKRFACYFFVKKDVDSKI
jgi:hypothetical protein